MLVKINGKEVEVGPSRKPVRKDSGWLGKFFQALAEQSRNSKSRLIINGHEVDMDNPDDVQKALYSCRITGGFIVVFGIIILLVTENEVDWANFDFTEDFGGLFAVSIWLILGTVFAIFTPKSLQKRLQELKREGKVPSKYGK